MLGGPGQARYEVSIRKGESFRIFSLLGKSQLDIASFLGIAPKPCAQRVMGESALVPESLRVGLFWNFLEKKLHPVSVRFMSPKTTIKMAVFFMVT